MTPEQQAFEDHCWEHYLAERARRTLPGDVDGEPTREGLFWRREDGSYGVLAFNAAWLAYQWGRQDAQIGQGEPVAADAERYGQRLNDASWAAVEAWTPEIMGPMTGAIFNNLKGVVRAAILKYCEGYTHPAPQQIGQGEPVAWIRWEWNRSGRKSLVFEKPTELSLAEEATGVIYEQLYTHPAPQQKPLTDEQDRALCEAYCNAASDEYFKARPQLDSDVNRRIFYAGHRKAWIEWQSAHNIGEKK